MDRYAAFIWPAYAVTVLVFLVMIVAALAHARRWKRKAEELGRK